MSDESMVPTGRLGIAVGTEGVWAVPLGRLGRPAVKGRVWHRALDDTEERDFVQAFRSLREELQGDGAIVHVALLPSVVQSRRLQVPPLKRDMVRQVLRRYAKKYFFLEDDAVVVDATILGRSRRRLPVPVLGSAVSTRLLDVVFGAADAVGWTVDSVVPAYEAWAAALSRVAKGQKDFWLVLCVPDRTELLRFENARVTAVRVLRNDSVALSRLPELMELATADGASGEADEPAVPVAVLGVGPSRDEVDALMADWGVEPVAMDPEELKGGAAGAAAAHAAEARGAELVPETVRAMRRRVTRRTTFGLATAAVAMLVGAAAVSLVGARRELAAIADRRAQIRASVQQAIDERDTLLTLTQRLTTLAGLEESVPHWSATIAAVAEHLPTDAHLVSLRARGDTLVLEGIAGRAAGVFEAFQAAPGMADVRAEAPVRRETRGAERPVERFTLAATLLPADPSDGRP